MARRRRAGYKIRGKKIRYVMVRGGKRGGKKGGGPFTGIPFLPF